VTPFERYPKSSIHLDTYEETIVATVERLHLLDEQDIEQRDHGEAKAFERTVANFVRISLSLTTDFRQVNYSV
jgi:hypothetical protein